MKKRLINSQKAASSIRIDHSASLLALLLLTLTACSTTPPAPIPDILPCYQAKTESEYERWLKIWKKKKNIIVAGKRYACVDNATPVEAMCYMAKTKKEFVKLSKEQDAHPERSLKIGKKFYRCIQETQ